MPVESLVNANQGEYYNALQESTEQTDAAPFITFMLRVILDTLPSPHVAPQLSGEVRRLLAVLNDVLSREDLQGALGLRDRKSFRERYLRPALDAGLIEMTLPDKPNSRLQRYRLTALGHATRGSS